MKTNVNTANKLNEFMINLPASILSTL